ncbi:MAG: signal peptidase I [Candidatus Moranbacteria bacterium]|nr:signal peptidase I [Candidatus Moranbacteria bacterium]
MEEEYPEREYDEKNQNRKESEGGFFSFVFDLAKIIILSLVIIIPIRTFLFQPFFVQGKSMEPNFQDGEYLIVNEFGYKKTKVAVGEKELFTVTPFKEFERGEVAVFRYPDNPEEYFIKRIIGLPGEKIEIKGGDVIVYNKQNPTGGILDETRYLEDALGETECSGSCVYDLKDDEYLVLGDNRGHSSDSRRWGALSKEYVIGKVFLRAWPFTDFKVF